MRVEADVDAEEFGVPDAWEEPKAARPVAGKRYLPWPKHAYQAYQSEDLGVWWYPKARREAQKAYGQTVEGANLRRARQAREDEEMMARVRAKRGAK